MVWYGAAPMRQLFLTMVMVLSSACVKRVVPVPTEATVTLGGQKASYRDWSRVVDLCMVDPTVVQRDFDSMSALLANFLGQTAAGPDGVWAEEHVALLQEGQRVLPTPLALQKTSLGQVRSAGCKFQGAIRTEELNDQATRRLAEAPALLEVVKAKKAVAAWRDALPAAQQMARERSCAPPAKGQKPAPGPLLFAAFEDEKGRTEWLFCDGAKVAASPGNVPAYEAAAVDPSAKKAKKPADPKAYLEAQAKFPSSEVNRAPKLPSRRAAAKDDAKEPEGLD